MAGVRSEAPKVQFEISLRTIAAVLGVIAGIWLLKELLAMLAQEGIAGGGRQHPGLPCGPTLLLYPVNPRPAPRASS